MKRLMHLCLTSKNEVMCRSHRDYQMMISRIAQAAVYNDTQVLAYAVMSNHTHMVVQTSNENSFIRSIKGSYTQTFNYLYSRTGSLFDKGFFKMELKGISHQQDALTYVLQNPWHHNVLENPFDYPYSSMNLYFKRYFSMTEIYTIRKNRRLLNRNVKLELKFGVEGNVIPESFVEIYLVENIFGSYNAYNYLIHRKNYKEWKQKQDSENLQVENVNLQTVEPLLNINQIQEIENNPQFWRRNTLLTDIEVCKIIDEEVRRKYRCASYCLLNPRQKLQITQMLLSKFRYKVSENQVKRCLGFSGIV